MRLSLDLDTPRMMLSAAVGGGAILAHPQLQLAVAVLLAALASVLVDVIKAVGRWAVHRLTRDIPKVAEASPGAVASGDVHHPNDVRSDAVARDGAEARPATPGEHRAPTSSANAVRKEGL